MKKIKFFIKNFALCGLIGWCWECLWTGLHSAFRRNDKELTCHTSLWMFPIYGMAAILKPLCRLLRRYGTIVRGLIYTLLIFTTEFITGILLKEKDSCPWDYSKAKYNIKGVIRLDYAPAWFLLSLLYEKLLKKMH